MVEGKEILIVCVAPPLFFLLICQRNAFLSLYVCGVLSACIAVPCVYLVPKKATEDVGLSGSGMVGSCKLPYGF